MAGRARGGGSRAAADFEASVIESLMRRLEVLVPQLVESGATLPDPDDAAAAMITALPTSTTHSEYDRLVGPFYSSGGVMRLLDIPTKQALDDRRRRGTVLAARTSDDVWVYPAFQFDADSRAVRPSLKPVLSALKSAPRWGAALWLVTAHPELDDRSPADAADDPESQALVRRLAEQYAQARAA